MEHKDKAFSHFHIFSKRVEKEKDFSILRIRSDRGEFINHSFITYCEENGVNMNYLVLELHNKMESFKGIIALFKRWLGQ